MAFSLCFLASTAAIILICARLSCAGPQNVGGVTRRRARSGNSGRLERRARGKIARNTIVVTAFFYYSFRTVQSNVFARACQPVLLCPRRPAKHCELAKHERGSLTRDVRSFAVLLDEVDEHVEQPTQLERGKQINQPTGDLNERTANYLFLVSEQLPDGDGARVRRRDHAERRDHEQEEGTRATRHFPTDVN